MSFQSMAWATSQKLEHATDKYLLIMLANYANADGECYPSVERISEDTSMDRKTVMKCLSNLIKKKPRYKEFGGQDSNSYWILVDKNEVVL